MDIKKPDRSVLKSYFVKNAIPTAGNFADLIDGLINQKEDGIVKPTGEPLSLQADGDDTSFKKAINFYKNFADPKPAWTLSLNSRVDPGKPETTKPGLSFGDADGNAKLFIDQTSGNVGIGTAAPTNKLDVAGIARLGAPFNSSKDPDSGMSNGGSLVIKSNAPQIDFVDTDHNDWSIHVNSNKMYFIRQPWNYSDLVLDGGGNVGVGTDAPKAKLEVRGGAIMPSFGNASAGIQFPSDPAGGSGDNAWIRYYARHGEACTLEIGIANDGDDHIALMSSGNVGIGTTEPKAKLDVRGTSRLDVLQIGDKFRLSGGKDFWADDEWLRMSNVANTGYGGGFAAGKMWTNQGQYNQSDLRLKTDVTALREAPQNVLKLRGVRFKWRDAPGTDPSVIGLVAQEVEQVFPEAVTTGPDGMKGINYSALIAPLIEAVKAQQAQIGELRAELQVLKAG